MKPLSFEIKLAIVERNGRLHSKSSVAIARIELFQAEKDCFEAKRAARLRFDRECWDKFVSEFTPEELAGMASHELHRRQAAEQTIE